MWTLHDNLIPALTFENLQPCPIQTNTQLKPVVSYPILIKTVCFIFNILIFYTTTSYFLKNVSPLPSPHRIKPKFYLLMDVQSFPFHKSIFYSPAKAPVTTAVSTFCKLVLSVTTDETMVVMKSPVGVESHVQRQSTLSLPLPTEQRFHLHHQLSNKNTTGKSFPKQPPNLYIFQGIPPASSLPSTSLILMPRRKTRKRIRWICLSSQRLQIRLQNAEQEMVKKQNKLTALPTSRYVWRNFYIRLWKGTEHSPWSL